MPSLDDRGVMSGLVHRLRPYRSPLLSKPCFGWSHRKKAAPRRSKTVRAVPGDDFGEDGLEGANLAMFDGAELVKAFLHHPDDIAAALAAYERDLFPWSAEIAEASARNLARFFGEAASWSVVDPFKTG